MQKCSELAVLQPLNRTRRPALASDSPSCSGGGGGCARAAPVWLILRYSRRGGPHTVVVAQHHPVRIEEPLE